MNKILGIGLAGLVLWCGALTAGEVLYNGIELPDRWPPQRGLDEIPKNPPYLENIPAVIPVDLGRQLFVDDFLIEEMKGLWRSYHSAEFHKVNPSITFDKPWEKAGDSPIAYPYSGGVCFDPTDDLYKMWYSADLDMRDGHSYGTHLICMAISKDGIHWKKPNLDVEPGTNIVLREYIDSTTVWLDHNEKDPAKKFKLFGCDVTTFSKDGSKQVKFVLFYSPDGIHWTNSGEKHFGMMGDRSTVAYNPFRKVWIGSVKWYTPEFGRCRAYMEHSDAAKLITNHANCVSWTVADDLDPRNPTAEFGHIKPQIYNLDCMPYESMMLGLFAIWRGPDNRKVAELGSQKYCDLLLGYSRDGFHWDRPWRKPFIAQTNNARAYNFANVQSAGGGCLVVGDRLFFYVSSKYPDLSGAHARCSGALATLRRDGFVSIDANETVGTLTTRPIKFEDPYLFINVDAPKGEVRVEVLDESGKPIPGYTADECVSTQCDKTLVPVHWDGLSNLKRIAAKPVRLRFYLQNASLYSFWTSKTEEGASGGYIAASGPGFDGPVDDKGKRAYVQAYNVVQGGCRGHDVKKPR